MSLHEDWLKLKALVERECREVDDGFHKLISEIAHREDQRNEAIQAAKDAVVVLTTEPVVEPSAEGAQD